MDKEYLEDECHDTLARRILHEHDDVTRVWALNRGRADAQLDLGVDSKLSIV